MATQCSFMPFIKKPISLVFLLERFISFAVTALVQLKKTNETEKVNI